MDILLGIFLVVLVLFGVSGNFFVKRHGSGSSSTDAIQNRPPEMYTSEYHLQEDAERVELVNPTSLSAATGPSLSINVNDKISLNDESKIKIN